jgi:hypothetical protein
LQIIESISLSIKKKCVKGCRSQYLVEPKGKSSIGPQRKPEQAPEKP